MKKSILSGRGNCLPWPLRFASFTLLLILMTSTVVWGRVGGPCVNCHTMHNSQNGVVVIDATIGIQPALVNTDCVGCHSNDSDTIKDLGDGTRIPIVYTTNVPSLEPGSPTSMLAGGNFHWVANGDDTKGHNVYRISSRDGNLSRAPGDRDYAQGCDNCHGSLANRNTGCMGCHLPAHHADDSATIVVKGAQGAYRFLGDVMGNVFFGWPPERADKIVDPAGVEGIEDPDWEQTVSSTDHNVYAGTATLYEPFTLGSPLLTEATVGQMCAGCHGNFHHEMNSGQTGGSYDASGVWIRHPSDVLIPDEGEYAAYTTYSPLAPPAKQNLTDGMKNSPTVTPGEDIVTCISCHRPHGSPYPDMLRWDYDTCQAGTANDECGCYVCHTAKDD